MKKENIIIAKTFNFSLKTIELYKVLVKQNEYVISKQLLKSATSIGANVEEANAGQTKKDFIAKMAIASKEARETKYWLRLLEKSQIVKYNYSGFLSEIEEIIRILTSIIKTSQLGKTNSTL
ncbi:MAG: four helix bundle protein [Cytophagaceae bacterium]|nr:four helix bundle protein [Cytophagaceae bacterium]